MDEQAARSLCEGGRAVTRDELIAYQEAHKGCPYCGHLREEHNDGSCLSDDPEPCWCDLREVEGDGE